LFDAATAVARPLRVDPRIVIPPIEADAPGQQRENCQH
jgi:hypothetical protein